MNDLTPTREERIANLKGMGTSRKRVEDVRFTQGKGNYVDDIKLQGMLFGDFVRSPYAHARVKSINADAARALPGVVAVLTAADLAPLNLHWMPTLAGDKQMVLADGKVLFQGQEVAFVVATAWGTRSNTTADTGRITRRRVMCPVAQPASTTTLPSGARRSTSAITRSALRRSTARCS